LNVAEALFEAFLKMILWVMYGLPVGLFCLFASQISEIGLNIFVALGKLILGLYVASFILLGIYLMTAKWATRRSLRQILTALKEPIFVAMGTSSSFATIPVALVALEQKLELEKKMANLVVPLGISLNPQGTIVRFAVTAIFMSQLYGMELGIDGLLFVVVGSILGGTAVTGVPAVVGLSMMSIVLDPLGLPTATAVILLIAINPVTDPLLTTVNVMANCTAATLVANKPEQVVRKVIAKAGGA
jgi:proton glutamate symport protein